MAQAPMVRARYTAAKFCQGQLRIICDNSYNRDVADTLESGPITTEKLWDLIAPAFHPEVRGAHVGVFNLDAIISPGESRKSHSEPVS